MIKDTDGASNCLNIPAGSNCNEDVSGEGASSLANAELERTPQSIAAQMTHELAAEMEVGATAMPTINFDVECVTQMGDSLIVTGDHEVAGWWDPSHSQIKLTTDASTYPRWAATVTFPEGASLEYKFVVLFKDGGACWEDGIPNRRLKVEQSALVLQAKFNRAGEEVTNNDGSVERSPTANSHI